jgi:hypothetical protein
MIDFLQTSLTFPTLAYSILLAFCVVYWLLAMTGLFDVDALDGLLMGDGDIGHGDFGHVHVGHGDASHAGAGHSDAGHGDAGDSTATAGMLARLGLSGVPIMIVLTVLSFLGWIITYFVHLLVLGHLPDSLRILAGIGTLLGALVPGVLLTSLVLRPVARLMARLQPVAAASILGRVGTVISPQVDAQGGRAAFDDGGAGLILQVRAPAGVTFARGERVVLLSHDAQAHTHAVISETEFNNR